MPLCQRCAPLTINELVDNDVLFHADMGALKASAERGCEFCLLCWDAVHTTQEPRVTKLIRGESAWLEGESWTPTVWLRGVNFSDRGDAGAKVEVTCGKLRDGGQGVGEPEPGVIDVGSPGAPTTHVRLVATNGLRERYIALSYCWGADTSGILILNASTHAALTQGVPETQLAKTHREVVSLARALGIRYVWVDALCIIQGDAQDWERESKAMAEAYGNAALTVIAARSAASKDGFITNDSLRAQRRPSPCVLPVDGSVDAGVLAVGPLRSDSYGPVAGRGWCFQEKMLSRRAVVFAEEQLGFYCAVKGVWENGVAKPNLWRPRFLQRPVSSTATTSNSGTPKRPAYMTAQDEMLQGWYGLLTQFTACQLSNPHDVFAAIIAVAQQASRVLNSRYLAGIWECDIVRGLLWRPAHHFRTELAMRQPTTRPKPSKFTTGTGPVIRAPSWSWAAVEGPISLPLGTLGFTPGSVARQRDPAYPKIRPKHSNPVRWSVDDKGGIDALHIPACELQLVGHVAKVRVLTEPVLGYIDARMGQRYIRRAGAVANGVLLAEPIPSGGTVGGEPWDQVVGLAFFDVKAERNGVEYAWCLPVVPDLGLLLERKPDGKFSRLGFVYEVLIPWTIKMVEAL
ncbi:heterokaryon incompatibility protein-domain-containing protein [Chaetomium tenue]|uniref:Heterokaryon incompatibility protein-domain-containing protein n=1 Tax=Chaetomium tenue TaxID=1854479 RepID=A0ACB7P1N1_9PEZI|nr:heterokaryon incompatibility protein-domain-containing protein [Chaetomium globosum]